MENLKNIAPLADFDWDSFESGNLPESGQSKADLEKAYDDTLNKVNDHEVVKVRSSASPSVKWLSTSATNPTESSP